MENTTLHRGVPGKLVSGVCAAIALRLGVDPLFVRVTVALTALMSGGIVLWLYCLLWLLTPPSADGRSPVARFVDWLANLFGPTAHSNVEG